MQQRGTVLPASAVTVTVNALARPVARLYGGLPLDYVGGAAACTSGFGVVNNGTVDRGVTTAGHCANDLQYAGTPLTFQSENNGFNQDAQWHTGWQFTITNLITDPSQPGGTRDITSRTFWGSQVVGGLACKYGRATGYGCGFISSKDSAGCNTGGGVAFIIVQSQGADLAEPGDSGGPTFVDHSAYGQMTCKQGLNFHYVATDFIENGLRVTVLTAP
jgi:hypothetical protein